jgi:hypothetical protein
MNGGGSKVKKLLMSFVMILLPVYASALTPPGSTAEAQVNGSVAMVKDRTQMVFDKMEIDSSASSVEKSGAEQTLQGKKGDLDIEVKLEKVEQAQNQTKVQVTAKQGTVKWNNDFAEKVLDNIVAAG